MTIIKMIIAGMLLPVFTACSTQPQQPVSNADSIAIEAPTNVAVVSFDNALPAPDLTLTKAGKQLKLVRIMEGGACKNKQYGAVGMFRLYANPEDIDRIKQKQGAGAFAEFERRIETFSMQAMQQSINRLDFKMDSSSSDSGDVQLRLADQLSTLFLALIADDISVFEAETTLAIEVIPLPDSLYIYLKDCETKHKH